MRPIPYVSFFPFHSRFLCNITIVMHLHSTIMFLRNSKLFPVYTRQAPFQDYTKPVMVGELLGNADFNLVAFMCPHNAYKDTVNQSLLSATVSGVSRVSHDHFGTSNLVP